MQPFEVKAALARLAASLFILCAMVGLAQAGDRATFNPLGYAPDSQVFAYEEYGVQDGSGLAYSSIYIVDLAKDQLVDGSPYRVMASEEHADTTLFEVRQQVLAEALPQLTARRLGEQPEILTLLGDGVPDADGKSLAFGPPVCCGPGDVGDARFTLRLATFPVNSPDQYCRDEKPVGFSLALSDGKGMKEIHRDGQTVPKSRRCPLEYRLYAVLQPTYSQEGRLAVISVYSLGFEGPDRRFIVVPVPGE